LSRPLPLGVFSDDELSPAEDDTFRNGDRFDPALICNSRSGDCPALSAPDGENDRLMPPTRIGRAEGDVSAFFDKNPAWNRLVRPGSLPSRPNGLPIAAAASADGDPARFSSLCSRIGSRILGDENSGIDVMISSSSSICSGVSG